MSATAPDMTRVSRSGRAAVGPNAGKLPDLCLLPLVARPVLSARWMCLSLALLALLEVTACVIPPELEPDTGDAGPSSPPVIVEAGPSPDFQFPGPVVLARQDSRRMSLTLKDNDVADVLYIKLYVDYGRPTATPAWADCQAAPSGVPVRIAECPVSALCTSIGGNDASDHYLEAMVADRPFLAADDPDQPPYRALDDIARAAWSVRSWLMRCASDET
jgi:hypothetical protein